MGNENLKTEIVAAADDLAEIALRGELVGVTLAWMTADGKWYYKSVGTIAPLTMIGMLEGVKTHILTPFVPPQPESK